MRGSIDIPTALTAREMRTLQVLAAGNQVVEAGSLLGYSTVALAQVARRVVSIDPHDGYPYWQPRPTLPIFRRNLRRHGVAQVVDIRVGRGEQHLSHYRADLAFLDLTGEYGTTMRCLEATRAEVITCHDFARGGCGGATAAVEEFARARRYRIKVVDTLAILEAA